MRALGKTASRARVFFFLFLLFVFRALWFARGFDSPLPSFDQNVSSRTAGADEIAWSRNVEEFDHIRRATLDFFRNLREKYL